MSLKLNLVRRLTLMLSGIVFTGMISCAVIVDFLDLKDKNWFLYLLALVSALIVGGAAYRVILASLEPLRELNEIIQVLKSGNLKVEYKSNSNDEFGEIGSNLNGLITRIDDILTKINDGQFTIRESSKEINKGNEMLAKAVAEQATSLQDISATSEELSMTMSGISENSMSVNDKTQQAAARAVDIAEYSDGLKDSINEIRESSDKIAKIIDMIQEIAFQTNLLSLNAAIEAARAGDKGRGFAVVAIEIRALAQRTAGAAKDVKSLVEESREKVAQGSSYIGKVVEALDGIVGDVEEVAVAISGIDKAIYENTKGVEQLNKSVARIEEITQHNAAVAEQLFAITQGLHAKAEDFSTVFDFFKFKNDELKN